MADSGQCPFSHPFSSFPRESNLRRIAGFYPRNPLDEKLFAVSSFNLAASRTHSPAKGPFRGATGQKDSACRWRKSCSTRPLPNDSLAVATIIHSTGALSASTMRIEACEKLGRSMTGGRPRATHEGGPLFEPAGSNAFFVTERKAGWLAFCSQFD
jgi:hypothetical protein